MARVSTELNQIYRDCIQEAQLAIKRYLRRKKDKKILFDQFEQFPVYVIHKITGDIESVWCVGVALDVENIKIISPDNEYFSESIICCDWLDVLTAIEDKLNKK